MKPETLDDIVFWGCMLAAGVAMALWV